MMPPDPAEFVRTIVSRSRRRETQCGLGTMTWRCWGEGPALVFFHGASGSWTHWIRIVEDLSNDYALWIPDLPGCGASAQPIPPNDVDGAIAALSSGLSEVLPNQPFSVIAFSAGAVFGAEIALRFAPWITQLVLVDAGGLGIPIGTFLLKSSQQGQSPEEIQSLHRYNLRSMMIADPNRVDPLALYLQTENLRQARFSPSFINRGTPVLDRLRKISVPLAAIWGSRDAVHPHIETYSDLLRKLQPLCRFQVIEDAGHWVMYEAPCRFRTALRAALV